MEIAGDSGRWWLRGCASMLIRFHLITLVYNDNNHKKVDHDDDNGNEGTNISHNSTDR